VLGLVHPLANTCVAEERMRKRYEEKWRKVMGLRPAPFYRWSKQDL